MPPVYVVRGLALGGLVLFGAMLARIPMEPGWSWQVTVLGCGVGGCASAYVSLGRPLPAGDGA